MGINIRYGNRNFSLSNQKFHLSKRKGMNNNDIRYKKGSNWKVEPQTLVSLD